MPIESFSIDCSSDVSYTYFNNQFPINMVMGAFSIEGSVTIPGDGRNSNHTANALQDIFAKAGAGTGAGSSALTPVQIGFYWLATPVTNAPGTDTTIPTAVVASRDLHIRVNGVITDITTGGDNEMTTTISFSGRNTFTTAGALSKKAISIDMMDDLSVTWGYDAKASSGFY
tara:strand:- start:1571 stop:2086 length:516 start_codon:yes stop_codon:yes gene_type:complete